VVTAVKAAQDLLVDIGFDGTVNYLPNPKKKVMLKRINAKTLDSFNNRVLCPCH
jgi:hypothetical protein